MNRRVIAIVLSIPLIALWLYAAITKLTDYYNFEFGLSESPFIGQFSGLLSYGIPILEIIIAILLAWPRARLAGFYSSFILLVLFIFYIGAMLLSGSEIPCSCGGVIEQLSWPMHIVFNSFFALIGLAGILLETKRKRSAYTHLTLEI
jgi:hypothetical protein